MSQLDTALLTLEQAKAKWCPEARSPDTEDAGVPVAAINRTYNGDKDSGSMCLGEACMFWRWHDGAERGQKHTAVAKALREPVLGDGNEIVDEDWTGMPADGQAWELDEEEGFWYVPTPPLPPRGYCGKAGHPHAATLIEAQLELLRYQLHDHRRVA